MKLRPSIAILTVALAVLSPTLLGQQRFPPPEFEKTYTMPTTATPAASATWAEYVDLAVLVLALAAGSFLAIRARYRGAIVALGVAALLYFGFYRGGCVCPIGAIQNVSMALFGVGYAVPLAVVAFFVLPLLTALFFGRTFCGAVCPLGATQDLLVVRPIRVPTWLEHSLGMLPWVYLAAAVVFAATGSAMIICRYDPFVSIFRMLPIGKMLSGWARRDPALVPEDLAGRLDTLLLAGSFLAIGLFVARPYCRFFCPYGVLLGLLSKLSWWKVTVTPTDCIHCRLCEDACPFGAILKPTAEIPPRHRLRGKTALAIALAVLPVLVLAGGVTGGLMGGLMARAHPVVALADRVRQEADGTVEGTTVESDAFRSSGRPAAELYAEARGIEKMFVSHWSFGGSAPPPAKPAATAGGWTFGAAHLFGAFVGLAIGLKIISLSVRRTRRDYVPDRAKCVACGRCFAHCPVEHARRNGTPVKLPAEKTDS